MDPHISNFAFQLSSTLVVHVLRKITSLKKEKYPILRKDVMGPEMFDAWLNDQEASLAQCVNGLFEDANKSNYARDLNHGHLRRTLSDLYQGAECSFLHRRLKAYMYFPVFLLISTAFETRIKRQLLRVQPHLIRRTAPTSLGV